MTRIIHLLSFLLLTLFSFGQEVTVLNFDTDLPIEDVFIYSKDHSSITDKHGKADLSKFSRKDSIVFQHTSYQIHVTSIDQLKESAFHVALQPSTILLGEISIAANRWEQSKDEIAYEVVQLDPEIANQYQPQTTADLLGTSGKVFIQKSQLGGGSPMIRGFAANRVLLVLDNVRLNNAIYRSGNLHNIISLDANSLKKTEVILGPGSVIYGSDAIGGVIHFHSKQNDTKDSIQPRLNVLSRYATASNEKTGHIDGNWNIGKLRMHTGFTYSDYNHLRMGSRGPDEYLKKMNAVRRNGRDTIVFNRNDEIQNPTGFNQFNIEQHFSLDLNASNDLNYSFFYSESSDIPRYDRLLEILDGTLRFAQWEYGPQKWVMHHVSWSHNRENAIADNFNIHFAFQEFNESRHDRRFKSEWLRNRFEAVDLYSVNADFRKQLESLELFYGGELTYNQISSFANTQNIETNEWNDLSSRYPDGATMQTSSVYMSGNYSISNILNIQGGFRYAIHELAADIDTTYFPFPFTRIKQSNDALSGSLGASYMFHENWTIKSNLSSGFRSPNIDDAAKIFDSEPGNVVVPNPQLKAEQAINTELSLEYKTNTTQLSVTGFYSWMNNALVRGDFTLLGADSIFYDGELSQVQAVINADNAKILGLETQIELELLKGFKIRSQHNITRGEEDNGQTLRHVVPIFGRAELQWVRKAIETATYIRYQGEISNHNMAESEQAKTHIYILDDAGLPYSPAWMTLNWRGKYRISDELSANVVLENILDKRYRPYSSGIVAPGLNLSLSLRGSF